MIWVEERRNWGEKSKKRKTEKDFSAGISTANIKCCYQKAIANYTDYLAEAKAPCVHNPNFRTPKVSK